MASGEDPPAPPGQPVEDARALLLPERDGRHRLHEAQEHEDGGADEEAVRPGQVADAGEGAAEGQHVGDERQHRRHPQADLLRHRRGRDEVHAVGHEDDQRQGHAELPGVVAPVPLEGQLHVEAREGAGPGDPGPRARLGPRLPDVPALDGQALVHPRHAKGVEDDLVGPGRDGPHGDLPAMPVEREVAEVQRVGELDPQAPSVGDHSPPVHEEARGVERLPAPQVLGLERGDPQPAIRGRALGGGVAPGGVGQPRVAPPRHHQDVCVQGLVDVAQGGHVLEEDPQPDHGGPRGPVGTIEGVGRGVGTGRDRPRR